MRGIIIIKNDAVQCMEKIKMNNSMKEHWNEIYEELDVDELTWYET